MTQVTVGRWGKNLAVRLPATIASETSLREGEQVDIETRGSTILIRRVVIPLTAEELFKAKTPDEWQAIYQDAYDWGPDVGQEIVGE